MKRTVTALLLHLAAGASLTGCSSGAFLEDGGPAWHYRDWFTAEEAKGPLAVKEPGWLTVAFTRRDGTVTADVVLEAPAHLKIVGQSITGRETGQISEVDLDKETGHAEGNFEIDGWSLHAEGDFVQDWSVLEAKVKWGLNVLADLELVEYEPPEPEEGEDGEES